MSLDKKLGRISDIKVGFGGYQDAMFGVTLSFAGDGWGVGTFIGTWFHDPDEHHKWTVDDQSKHYSDMCRELCLC